MDNYTHFQITHCSALHMAYLAHTGVERVENTFQQALQWAKAHQCLAQPHTQMCRVFHDSFRTTKASEVRMSIGVATPFHLPESDLMQYQVLAKGQYLIGHFTLHIPEFEQAWTRLFMQLHTLGLQKADGNPYELYHNDSNTHPEGKCLVELRIPVQAV